MVLIDDDQDDLDLLQDAINSYDPSIICVTFTTAIDAIKALSHSTVAPAVILTDLNMPMLSGEELVKRLRVNPLFNNTVIAIISTSALKDKEGALKQSGADYVFKKPNKFSEYGIILSQLLPVGPLLQ